MTCDLVIIFYLMSRMEKNKDSDNDIYECHVCHKKFKTKLGLTQHFHLHKRKQECKLCGALFSFPSNLKRHERDKHGLPARARSCTSFQCKQCHKSFNRKYHLLRHETTVHQHSNYQSNRTTFSCRHCECEFHTYQQLVDHIEEYHPLIQEERRSLNQEGGRQEIRPRSLFDDTNASNEKSGSDTATKEAQPQSLTDTAQPTQSPKNPSVRDTTRQSALRTTVENRQIYPLQNERYDMLTFFANTREEIETAIRTRVNQLGGIKWNLCVQVEMQRDDGFETTTSTPYFRSNTYRFLVSEELQDHELNEAFQKMFAALEKFQKEGSNWFLKKIIKLEIHTAVYSPISGSTFIPLPPSLALSRSILNIENENEKCFLYCVLASLHPQQTLAEDPELYEPYEQELDMTGIEYPVSINDIHKFEKQNENISINVFTFEDEQIVPMRITNYTDRIHHVDLLWLKSADTSHYCLIKNLNRFLSRTKTHQGQTHFCPYCLHGFRTQDLLIKHREKCSVNGAQKVILPSDGKDVILKFKEYEKTLKVPFVIYADFETVNVKLHTCMQNPEYASTTPTAKLIPCGYAFRTVCEIPRFSKSTTIYRGPNAVTKLIESLLEEQERIKNILSVIEPMPEHEGLIESAESCCLCKKKFTLYDRTYSKIVAHHNHLTGAIIGAACNNCNLNCKQAKFIPVMFHSLRNFDAHILCESLGQFKEHSLRCIPQTSERYISFSLGNLKFLDTHLFLSSSLESLVDNLKQNGDENKDDWQDVFPHLYSEFDDKSKVNLLVRKGIYPYEYMDSFARFEEEELPPIEEFYSSLTKEGISKEEYEHAKNVFREYNLSSLGEYHDLYVKTDVLLLSDVFESFRNVCLSQYELDPCHFYTSPGLSWCSLLKMTGIELELIQDVDMLFLLQEGTRGGLSQIANRYKRAQNPYLENYDVSRESSYLMYLDANNLYGWAMVQPLPFSDFKFLDEVKDFDVMSIEEDGELGYILEVCLLYPPELHVLHNCLPLAPEQREISNDELSPYAQHLLRKLHGLKEDKPLPARGRVKKLLATLGDKSNYVLHYRNLQLYVNLGMKITEIHKVLQFRQKPWMKPYIDFNTEKRKQAKSTFEKNFYKLMNVSVFGKTLQNERKYRNIELVHRENRLRKLTAKPTYKTTTIFNEDLVAVELLRAQVKLFKPSYCGMCILDLSKCLMYDFWYGYIKKKYGNKAQLQMTDTDSLLFYCETDDIYRDMLQSRELFDTSDYPKDHILHSDSNKKALGKMKDEVHGQPISEFVGLRSKMYSFTCKNKEEKRAKGISKVTIEKQIKHEHYKRALFGETKEMSRMTSLRSHRHELFCETINKTGLSPFDDKRFLINSVESYAYSHHLIRDYLSEDHSNEFEVMEIDVQGEPLTSNTGELNPIENQSFFLDDVKITPIQKVSSVTENQEFIQDQSFFVDDFKITPCK